MKTSRIEGVRRSNLRHLIQALPDGRAEFLRRVSWIDGSYLTQMAGPNPRKPITERTARKIEESLGVAPGTLDLRPDQHPQRLSATQVVMSKMTPLPPLDNEPAPPPPRELSGPPETTDPLALAQYILATSGELDGTHTLRLVEFLTELSRHVKANELPHLVILLAQLLRR